MKRKAGRKKAAVAPCGMKWKYHSEYCSCVREGEIRGLLRAARRFKTHMTGEWSCREMEPWLRTEAAKLRRGR